MKRSKLEFETVLIAEVLRRAAELDGLQMKVSGGVASFSPDQRAPTTGIYRLIHKPNHCGPSELSLCIADRFPRCAQCFDATFQFIRSAHDGGSGESVSHQAKRVFQIAYDQSLLITRKMLLQKRGYEVVSALGNTEAKQGLRQTGNYHLFIVGHAAPQPDRDEMVLWLKDKFPQTRILAMNDPRGDIAQHYNGPDDGPEKWLQMVEFALL